VFKKKRIDDWALDYWLLQQYAKLCFRLSYRRIEVLNRHNLPVNQSVILAPNHQNALMDAMVLVCNTSYQNVFLARADIFRGKRLIRFLTFLNIMPIYRIRDGIKNVKKNDEVFDRTLQVLHNKKNPLSIFPEGNHGDKRRLRPLVKGLFRIALQAQEKYGHSPGVKIVPIGYDYGHYQHFQSTLFVNIGEPIEVNEFIQVYLENPVLAINQMKERFAGALSKQMIDIQTEEYYELYMHLREIFNPEMRSILGIKEHTLAAKFKADKFMIDRLNAGLAAEPENIRQLDHKVKEYWQGIHLRGLSDWVIGTKNHNLPALLFTSLLKILLLPVFIFGFVNNYLPFWFAESRIRKIKDPQFQSSFKYVMGLLAFPVWYLIIVGILAIARLPFWIILSYVLVLPGAGLCAFSYAGRLKRLIIRWKFFLQSRHPAIKELVRLREEIIGHVQTILNRHHPAEE